MQKKNLQEKNRDCLLDSTSMDTYSWSVPLFAPFLSGAYFKYWASNVDISLSVVFCNPKMAATKPKTIINFSTKNCLILKNKTLIRILDISTEAH
jgi:hypothetical protein